MFDDDCDGSNDFEDFENEAKAVQEVTSALKNLKPLSREKVINSVLALLGGGGNSIKRSYSTPINVSNSPSHIEPASSFSEDRDLSPKEFILQKKPLTDVERVACLAYYMEHYREQAKFKTIDISKLNTEAAQRKFSNPTLAMKNAIQGGYLISADKGQRALSAGGEQFVLALPDREAARSAMSHSKPKRKNKAKSKSKSKSK